MADDWKSHQFRQNVVTKINEAIQASTIHSSKSAVEMENQIFQKARTKEEYVNFVAKLIMHVREMNSKNKNPQVNDGSGGNMPDPINALQNLASQGSRPQGGGMMNNTNNVAPQMNQVNPGVIPQSNLLQSLTQQRNPNNGHQQIVGGPSNPNQMGVVGNRSLNNQGIMGGPIQGNQVMGQQLPQPGAGQMQMQNTMNPQMGGMGGNPVMNNMNQMGPGMVANQMMPMGGGGVVQNLNPINNQAPMNPGMNQSMVNPGNQPNPNMMNAGQMIGMRKPAEMMMNSPGGVFQGVRSVTPNQFLRQSPSPSVPSPAGGMGSHPNQMIPSPSIGQLPSPQMPGMINVPNRSIPNNVMAPSPGSSLNTPGQPAIQSPMNPQEDQLYREKYRQLTKYIEPLKRMVARMVSEKNNNALQKMNKLLEILCNPHSRIPLDTLLKCEKALEKMDLKILAPVATPVGMKETNNPLLEAVTANLQSPIRNHTLQRTFKPCLDSLFGSDIPDYPLPAKQARISQVDSSTTTSTTQSSSLGPDIPHILQGEIARLDQKFKINLDPSCQPTTKTIKLICCLDDKHLPCVPPVIVTIPEDYPLTAPSCNLTEHEYNATSFLVAVQNALTARISKLPCLFSLSHLLDTWELSVRQACTPSKITAPTEMSVLLGF